MNLNETEIQNNTQWHRFELPVENEMAVVQYTREGDVFLLMHTEVPEQLEGKGIASTLVQKTMEYLDAHHFKMRPYCPYIHTFLKRHPEWDRLVSPE